MKSKRPGQATLIAVLGVAALGGLIWAGITASSTSTTAARRSLKRLEPARRVEVEVALERIGLTPNSVAAAGFTPEMVSAIVGDTASSLRSNIQALRTADAAAGTAYNEVARLTRLIQSGLSTGQDRAALDAAQASLASARADAQSVLNTAYIAGTVNLNGAARAVLETIHANKGWDMPTQYQAANRGEPAWVDLRDALANDRISRQLGVEPDPSAHQLLLTVNADPAVAAAAANLANLPQLQAAWGEAVGP